MTTRSARPRRAAAPLRTAIALACAGLALGAQATTVVSSRIGDTRVVLPPGVYKPGEAGVELLQDYGSFQLYRLDAAHAVELGLVDSTSKPLSNTIQFNAEPLNAARDSTVIPAALRAQKPTGAALQVVQFVGPIADAWLKDLAAAGARVIQYIPDNAYIVRADEGALNALANMARDGRAVQFTTDYAPYYKLDTHLGARARAGLSASKELDVTVQVVGGFDNSQSKKSVERLALGKPLGDWFDTVTGQAIRLHIAESAVADLAQVADVLAVEEYFTPHKMDERQDQIIAGNLNATQSGPSGPGYVNWLTNLGFPTTGSSYPVVDIADDGLGTGVASTAGGDVMLRVNGVAAGASRVLAVTNCTADASGDGQAGHGHINSTIVGGYDARGGFPFIDPLGYQRGVGVNPFVTITHTKIFNNAGSFVITNCGGTDANLMKKEQNTGAYISSNSWGASTAGSYNTEAQAYDRGTRDADTSVANNQPMVFVFAAGNDGPGVSTVGAPGTAKNVITVGASENQRPSDEDGNWSENVCGTTPADADNAMDVAGFSSRGPTGSAAYARKKPEVIAPGTHIQGSASTDPTYDGSGVCDKYRPSGQTVFAASTGTSHSTPAMSGVASLVAYYVKNHFQTANPNYATAGVWPSAAAIKAYLMAHTTYLTGVSANDNLPSNNQGYGMPNLGKAFDDETLRYVNDQQNVLAATGATYTWTGVVADPTKPLKISMAFSDAPGATSGSPVVNNLDLSVVVNGNTYLGNVFTGQTSTTGGAADPYNNYEAVFLPAGVTGTITITVKATNIAGDGVPNNGVPLDQDFALVCSNCSSTPDFTISASPASVATCAGTPATFTAQVNALNGFSSAIALSVANLPSGATATFTPPSVTPPASTSAGSISTSGVAAGSYNVQVRGTSGATVHNGPLQLTVSTPLAGAPTLSAPANNAYGVSSTPSLTWSAVAGALNYVVEVDDDPSFGSINYTATVSSTSTSHTVATSLNANTHYYWRVKASNSCGDTVSAVFNFVTLSTPVCTTVASANVPVAIAAAGTPTITSTLTSAVSGTITDVNVVGLKGTHTWINDLDFKLTNPSSVVVQIMAQTCGNQDNFDLNLDDAASGTAGGWPCPPTGGGTYKPSNPLAGLNGSTATGTWTLTVHDNATGDGGSLTGWGLQICASGAPTLVDAVNDTYAVTLNTALTVAAPGVLANDVPATGLSASVVSNPAHGTLVLNTNGSFVYTPANAYCGSDSFTYQATNGSNSDTATVNFTMTCGGNTAPVANNDSYSGFEDTPISVSVPGVLANDTDADSNPLSAILVTGTAHGALTLNPNGSFGYTPTANYCGSDTFTYKANDGTADSNVATATITLACINDAPVAVNDSYSVNEDTPLVIAAPGVLGNDTDADANPLTAVLVAGPTHGTLALNPNGSFSYTPASNYNGADSFTYQASDGTTLSNTATISITVTAVNDAPVAVADSIAVNQGGTATILVGGATSVLANDTDVENSTLTAVLVTGPAHGTLTLNANGTFNYAQDNTATATDSFVYHACDSGTPSLCSNNVTVSIAVNLKPAPGCTVSAQLFKEGDSVSIALAGLFTDPEGQTLTYSATGLPNGLTLGAADGQLTGTIAAGAATGSPYAALITATDSGGASFSRTLSFNVLAAVDALFRSGFDDPADAAACH